MVILLLAILGIPNGFPQPVIPKDNPPTMAKIELGRQLFYERALSGNGTQSCADCHQQSRAFTDGRPRAIGSTGQEHMRSSMALANCAYAVTLTWTDPTVRTLEQQALVPLMNEKPVEMGVKGHEDVVLARIRETYRSSFKKAFPGEPITWQTIAKAIASFERTIISGRTRYDRYVFEGADALTAAEKRGMHVFFGDRARCGSCHGGLLFAGPGAYAGVAMPEPSFASCKTVPRFRVPSLRNIAVTAPYLHDGSLGSLDAVVDRYKTPITADEKHDLIAFFGALTDDELLTDPRLADPKTTWRIDKDHSAITFKVRHFVANVVGRFTDFEGSVTEDAVDLRIRATSIDTEVAERDKHLRSADFFDVARFPEIRFRSTDVKHIDGDRYEVTGDLTLHGVTKRITLPVKFLGSMNHPDGSVKGGFETAIAIDRRDFGMTWNIPLDDGALVIGNEVKIEISVEVTRSTRAA
jgi:cytochrome c peroxidase